MAFYPAEATVHVVHLQTQFFYFTEDGLTVCPHLLA